MSDIRQWLEELGLGQYADAFEANEIARDMLPDVTDQTLKDIGVAVAGHRIRLLKAIAALSETTEGGESAEEPTPTQDKTPEAERRQLTVMFCDLVGSTALSGKLDPEELRSVMQAYRKACANVIERYDGHVAQYLGDGVMVYFGWPAAHEDDAGRAVRAGLDIVDVVAKLETAERLEVRVGVATGLVVVGESGADEGADAKLAVGETPNIAARIQGLAESNTVVIAQSTRRLLGGTFALDDLGTHEAKGISGGLRFHRVLGAAETESRFEASRFATGGAALTPLVGRENEIAMLIERWDQAKDGEGQVVLLSGEAGIGKSRVTQVLRERLADEPHTRLRYQCSPYYTNSAFYPIIAQLERAAGFARDDDPDQRLDKLEALLGQETEGTALIAALLSLPIDRYPPLALSPQKQKENTIAALAEQVASLAASQPVLMIFEDAHWIDPTTLETLGAVIERVRDSAALVVITHRPEFEPPWPGHGHISTLTLNRLGRRQGAAMVAKVTGGKALPDEVLDQIVAKTDGVPLFVEELTKTVLEAGFLKDSGDGYTFEGPLPPLAIPATLQDSLMARIDRLSPVKEVAQLGACIGREFSYELLSAISTLRENELKDALQQLVNSELIFRRGTSPDAAYTFKHALVQDAAYSSLLKSKRQQVHKSIANALTAKRLDEVEPEIAGFHYCAAGLHEQAIPYLLAAGEAALRRTALAEAISHLSKALELNTDSAPSPERDRQELRIRNRLAPAYMAQRGWTAPDYERTVTPAIELGKRLKEPALLLPPLWGIWVIRAVRCEFDEALRWVGEMLAAAREQSDSDLEISGHAAAALTHHWMGEFVTSQQHCQRVLDLYDFEAHRHLVGVLNYDPKCMSLAWASHDLWILGYPDQAVSASDEQLRLARELNHATNLAFALSEGSGAHIYRREPSIVMERQNEARALAQEQGLPVVEAFSTRVWSCETELNQGRAEQAYETAKTALDWWQRIAAQECVPYLKMIMAAALSQTNQTAALTLIDESLSIAEANRNLWHLAEIHRIKGNLLVLGPIDDLAGAEQSYRMAIDVARAQQAKGWELRAAKSLAQLWGERGERQKAYDLLFPVYDWFTEGFDTADLKDAKALLEALK